ncbi:MAG: chorismate synthase [Candidatus Cloacimonetes bacterium]|jgi:chorismate synthase|nr:chorismate synthase [Candidatus Cloacimonadota bacterium]MDD2210223.1 chorismate synthase [Candidatus Cloacimonadota bacterium]MDD4688084.1 chorismate synthase [Candidatus Cloacimonadota bacterium]MDY0299813.1 chorismate synthase [Candidatus Cloacimonadaceae bacterium]
MPSNKLSQILGISTFGESHGPAIGILFDSPIPNQEFPFDKIRKALTQRAPQTKFATSRIEPDEIEILSGVFEGKTTGAPLCIVVYNKDARSFEYNPFKDLIRPGYADYSWLQKYHIFDYRGGGRASGRETVARVIAAELYRDLLKDIKIQITAIQIGEKTASIATLSEANPFHWPDQDSYPLLISYLKQKKLEGDSVGGVLRVRAKNIPPGLGDPIYEKLSANIAKAMFSIATIRGVLFGDGLDLARLPGSKVNDQFAQGKAQTNHHGGILGGVSTGSDLQFDLIIRPVSSIAQEQDTINLQGQDCKIKIDGRHDTCHIPRIIPVIEAMLMICLADAIQYQRLIENRQDLSGYREALDKLDEDLILILKRRQEIVRQVKVLKKKQHLPPKDTAREHEIIMRQRTFAKELSLNEDLVEQIVNLNLRLSSFDS